MIEQFDYRGHQVKLVMIEITRERYAWQAFVDGNPVGGTSGEPLNLDLMTAQARASAERHIDRKLQPVASA